MIVCYITKASKPSEVRVSFSKVIIRLINYLDLRFEVVTTLRSLRSGVGGAEVETPVKEVCESLKSFRLAKIIKGLS